MLDADRIRTLRRITAPVLTAYVDTNLAENLSNPLVGGPVGEAFASSGALAARGRSLSRHRASGPPGPRPDAVGLAQTLPRSRADECGS